MSVWQLSVRPRAAQFQITHTHWFCCIRWCLPVCVVPRHLFLVSWIFHDKQPFVWHVQLLHCEQDIASAVLCYCSGLTRVRELFLNTPQDRGIASTGSNIFFLLFCFKFSFNHIPSLIYLVQYLNHFYSPRILWPFVFTAPSTCDIVGCLHLCVRGSFLIFFWCCCCLPIKNVRWICLPYFPIPCRFSFLEKQ